MQTEIIHTQPTIAKDFFEVRVLAVPTDIPLTMDLYLKINDRNVLFRKRGDVLQAERQQELNVKGSKRAFLIPTDQRTSYLNFLKNAYKNPDVGVGIKSRFIKESAYIHVNDLFQSQDLARAVKESHELVENLVDFVSEDVQAVSSLMRLSAHDYYTYNHCVDVSVYAISLARKIFGEDKHKLMIAGLGGLLHDIGKRRVHLDIINKSSALSTDEWQEMRRHPIYGLELLKEISTVSTQSCSAVYEHHENFDGSGYPRGMSEDEISVFARIVTISDVFDALTTDRSYHKAVESKDALDLMCSMQPGKFDPDLFTYFSGKFVSNKCEHFHENFDPCDPRTPIKK